MAKRSSVSKRNRKKGVKNPGTERNHAECRTTECKHGKYDSIAGFVEAASVLAEEGNFSSAADKYASAIELHPGNASLYESHADMLMDAGRPEEAIAVLRKAIELDGSSGFEKHMYLGQLLGNSNEALSEIRKGINILRNQRSAKNLSSERDADLAGYEVSALCGVAEILLGIAEESNDEKTARKIDSEVELAIGQAVAACVEGSAGEVEASMALANLRLSQGRSHEALAAMQRVVLVLRNGLDVLEESDGTDDAIVRAMEILPPMDMRIAAGKQLLEVELWKDAVSVLRSVLYECDFNVEVWYMLSLAYHNLQDPDNALTALQNIRDSIASPEGYTGFLDECNIAQLDELIAGISNTSSDEKTAMMD